MNQVGGSAGAAHLGGQVIGGLRVIQRMPGVPVRWQCVCTRCGVSQVCLHAHLQTGFPRCVSGSGCGRRQHTADDDFRRERAQERQQAEQRAKDQQAEVDRKARIEAERKRQADSVVAKKAQIAAEAERIKKVQQARWESEFTQRQREEIFDRYQLTDDEIRRIMNDESVAPEDFSDLEQNHFHFLAMKIANQRGNR